jgi:hypothetical protein
MRNYWIILLLPLTLIVSIQEGSDMNADVFLNHFFIVLDSESYKAIEENDFLKNQFAIFEKRTTVRTDRTYTGLYFYGANTYFEFFDIAAQKDAQIGNSAIAFGTEQPGAIQSLQAKLAWSDPQTITREISGKQIPWFLMSTPKDFSFASGISVWVMGYVPEFLKEWHSETNDGQSGITRKAILARYASFLKQDPGTKMMQDATTITLHASQDARDSLTAYCQAFGYQADQSNSYMNLKGPGFTLKLAPESADKRGIQSVEFKLKKRADKSKELKFGKRSVLKLSKDKATWIF